MKLRKQSKLKALITALTTGLFLLFLGLIRADPRIEAEVEALPVAAPDYERFFAPASRGAEADADAPDPTQRPHTRTRAS